MNYDPPHLLPFAAPVPRAFFRVSRSNALRDLPRSLPSLPSLSLFLLLPPSLARLLFLSLSLLHHSLPLSWCAPCIGVVPTFGKEGLRSSCRLVGNAVPGAARTLRMVTKGPQRLLAFGNSRTSFSAIYMHRKRCWELRWRSPNGWNSIDRTTRLQR